MSVNPLQGIQVINSVNPCSSTPLHQPPSTLTITGLSHPRADPRPRPLATPLPVLLRFLPLVALSASIQSESRLTSPQTNQPTNPPPRHTRGKSRKLRLQRLFFSPSSAVVFRLARDDPSFLPSFFVRFFGGSTPKYHPRLLDPPPFHSSFLLPGLKL